VTTFARVAFLVDQRYSDEEIAFVIRRSRSLVAAYRQLYEDFQGQRGARQRLREILGRVAKNPDCSGAKGGRPS
jgi:hypothetical protein